MNNSQKLIMIILHLIKIQDDFITYVNKASKIKIKCGILTFDTGKMPFRLMHRKEVTHSNGCYERKSRGRKLADEMGRAKKIPMVHS